MSSHKTISTELTFPGVRLTLQETKKSPSHLSIYTVVVEMVSDDPIDPITLDLNLNLNEGRFFADYSEAKEQYERLLQEYKKLGISILSNVRQIK